MVHIPFHSPSSPPVVACNRLVGLIIASDASRLHFACNTICTTLLMCTQPPHGMFRITASYPSPPWQCTLSSLSIVPILLMTSLWWQPLGRSLVHMFFPYLMQHPQAQTGLINGSKALQRCSFDPHFCHIPLYGIDRNSYTAHRCCRTVADGMVQND